jgi:hypothetical protein
MDETTLGGRRRIFWVTHLDAAKVGIPLLQVPEPPAE